MKKFAKYVLIQIPAAFGGGDQHICELHRLEERGAFIRKLGIEEDKKGKPKLSYGRPCFIVFQGGMVFESIESLAAAKKMIFDAYAEMKAREATARPEVKNVMMTPPPAQM